MQATISNRHLPHVNWTAYAAAYDLMAENNPAYQEIVRQCIGQAQQWHLAPDEQIVDLGAGTGNFSIPLATALPHCQMIHIDGDRGMNALAQQKAATQNVRNISFIIQDLTHIHMTPGSLGAIVCVHALYTLPNPAEIIRRMYGWLRPGGYLFACDLGRLMDVGDWARFLFRESCRAHGFPRTVSMFIRGRVVARQNRLIAKMQQNGTYWQHSLDAYTEAFETAGFTIEQAFETYRGYSDVVVCRR